jgi:hypothetical protein
MKIKLLTYVVVLMTFVSTFFSSFGRNNETSQAMVPSLAQPKNMILITGDNDAAIAEKITDLLYEKYSSVNETVLEENGRVDKVYSFPASIFVDKELNALLADSRCVRLYFNTFLLGSYTSYCGLAGNTYFYHLAGSSLDNVYSSFNAVTNSSYAFAYDADPGFGNSYCLSPIGTLAGTMYTIGTAMNNKISCLEVHH